MSVNHSQNKLARLVSMIGFVVLSTLFGVGLAWILFGLWVIVAHKHDFPSAAEVAMSFLVGAGALGFGAGLAIAIRVTRSGPETEKGIAARYLRRRSDRVRIYGGAPSALSIALISLLFPHLERAVGDSVASYVALGIFLVIFGLSLFLYDRIPSKYIIPIGVIGWLLIVAAAIVFGFRATAALGHTH